MAIPLTLIWDKKSPSVSNLYGKLHAHQKATSLPLPTILMPLHRQQIVDKQDALTQQNKKRIKEAALPSSLILSYPLQDSTSPAVHRLS